MFQNTDLIILGLGGLDNKTSGSGSRKVQDHRKKRLRLIVWKAWR